MSMNLAGKYILIGLSGGPDSVALLHRLASSLPHETLLATHCNFNLRGEESMRDERFCIDLCKKLDIALIVKRFNTRKVMADEHLSLELAARRLRYGWWETLANEKQQETGREVVIAVGHHRDDSIETLLMNLMRGTGIKGLTGIPRENGRIVRPMSDLTRAEILLYLDENQLDYITDSSNLENDTVRNAIRNRLLPLMEEINPNARNGIGHTINLLRQTMALADTQIDTILTTTRHFCAAGVEWDEFHVPETLANGISLADDAWTETLFHHWSERHPDARRNGRLFYTAIRDIGHEEYTIGPKNEEGTEPFNFQLSFFNSTPFPPFSRDYELFDADRIQWPLTVRHWRQGDRIQPLGMSQTRLVSDLFTDAHFSPNRKATTWIVADASGRILWVVGLRVADWCKITGETQSVAKIEQGGEVSNFTIKM